MGVKLALITNGSAEGQRGKVVRFELERFFGCIVIEGEFGVGKPDERVYKHALAALATDPEDAWMVGDNLEWEVAVPQRLGLRGIWVDWAGGGAAGRDDRKAGPDSAGDIGVGVGVLLSQLSHKLAVPHATIRRVSTRSLMESGSSSPCSSYDAMNSAATLRRLANASSGVSPHALQPGSAGTSAMYIFSVSSEGFCIL